MIVFVIAMEIEKQATLPVKRNVKPITKKEVSTERRTAMWV